VKSIQCILNNLCVCLYFNNGGQAKRMCDLLLCSLSRPNSWHSHGWVNGRPLRI